jgi:hypothetical protein
VAGSVRRKVLASDKREDPEQHRLDRVVDLGAEDRRRGQEDRDPLESVSDPKALEGGYFLVGCSDDVELALEQILLVLERAPEVVSESGRWASPVFFSPDVLGEGMEKGPVGCLAEFCTQEAETELKDAEPKGVRDVPGDSPNVKGADCGAEAIASLEDVVDGVRVRVIECE